MFSVRRLHTAFKSVCLQRSGNSSARSHSLRPRAFASTPRTAATENPSFKESRLFQQLATNPGALLALREFGQLLKEQGIEFSPKSPPSSIQLFKLLANPVFRKGVLKLRDDLGQAGVDVDPESATELLAAFKSQNSI